MLNACERIAVRLRGDPAVDRAPNFNTLMALAAHRVGAPLARFYLDYRVLCEANLAVLSDFSRDLVGTISDPYGETADWGAAIEFPEDDLPRCTAPFLQTRDDIRKLTPIQPASDSRMSNRLQALDYYRSQVGGRVLAAAHDTCQGLAVNGNFDPVAVMLRGTPDQVHQAASQCLVQGGPRCFSMAGCEIPVGTPDASLLAHAQALREYGSRHGAPV